MSKPAFLIDGLMEKIVLEKICPNTTIRLINCNGNSVSIIALAKRIHTLIKILNNRNYPIFILIDREEREVTCSQIIIELEEELKKYGVSDDIRIGVCDRMIENWTLSDWNSFVKNSGIAIETITPENIEGCKGKSVVKKYYPHYQETTDGVMFFLKSNPEVMFHKSESFRNFISKTKDINCFWASNLFTKTEQI